MGSANKPGHKAKISYIWLSIAPPQDETIECHIYNMFFWHVLSQKWRNLQWLVEILYSLEDWLFRLVL